MMKTLTPEVIDLLTQVVTESYVFVDPFGARSVDCGSEVVQGSPVPRAVTVSQLPFS